MRVSLAALAVSAALLGACGDDDVSDPPTPTTEPPTATTDDLEPHAPPIGLSVTARDSGFEPTEWLVPTSALLVVDFRNDDPIEHYFVVVDGTPVESAADLADASVYRELRAGPNSTTSDSFLAPGEPGTYQIICTVPGHLEAGMEARLVVER